ncbi:MAG: glutathione peroxidase [Myxococcota bacterium]|nr:glutathione peroxidase [Myxococcota bacterium]
MNSPSSSWIFRTLVAALVLGFLVVSLGPASAKARKKRRKAPPNGIHAFTAKNLEGKDVALSKYKGKLVLIVNTASRCGYTPQYGKLQQLQTNFGDRGLRILGFPSNDHGSQEPGTDEDIERFVREKYDVTFDMFAKVHTRGKKTAPVFSYLTWDAPADIRGLIRWNFTKFLVGPDGIPVARFEPDVDPLDPKVIRAIEYQLAKKP